MRWENSNDPDALGAAAYSDAVVTYLAFAVDRLVDRNSTICTWDSGYVKILDGVEAELDAPTRFALTWFAQHGYNPGSSGDADNLARARGTSLDGIEEAGVGAARAGEFRLYERAELPEGWSPTADARLTVWEAVQYLVLALGRSETEAAALLRQLGGYGDRARQLAYLLFTKASDNGWASEAGVYNGLITAWPSLRAADVGVDAPQLW